MGNDRFDVAVLGSGLGGAILASILARLGLRVAILERRAQPRPYLGESMPRRVSLVLWMLGQQYDVPEILDLSSTDRLNERAVATCGARRSYGFLYHEPGLRQSLSRGQMVVPSPLPFCSESHLFRQDIDLYLIAAARRYGAVYRERSAVAAVEPGPRGVVLRCTDGTLLTARYVVDDSGRDSPLAAHFGLRQELPPLHTRTRSIYTQVKGLRRYDELLADDELRGLQRTWFRGTLHHVFDGGSFWAIPFDNHEGSINPLASLGVTLDLSRYPQWAATPEREFGFIAGRYPSIAAHVEGANPVRPWIATERLQFSSRSCLADRCLLMPGSAAFVDRFYGGDLASACEALYAVLPRLLEALTDDGLGAERFADLEAWRAARTRAEDRWMATSLKVSAHPETWEAWLRVWLAEAAFAERRWLERCSYFLATGDRSCLAPQIDDLVSGRSADGAGPLLELAETGAAAVAALAQGKTTPERAARQIREALGPAPLPPVAPLRAELELGAGGTNGATGGCGGIGAMEEGRLGAEGAGFLDSCVETPLKTKRPPRFPEAAPS